MKLIPICCCTVTMLISEHLCKHTLNYLFQCLSFNIKLPVYIYKPPLCVLHGRSNNSCYAEMNIYGFTLREMKWTTWGSHDLFVNIGSDFGKRSYRYMVLCRYNIYFAVVCECIVRWQLVHVQQRIMRYNLERASHF